MFISQTVMFVMKDSEPDNLWWQIEPPDHEYEPAYEQDSDSIEDQIDARAPRYTLDQLESFDYIDGSESHPIFDNVNILEADGELSFRVPTRFVDSSNLGKWELEVYGGRRWFKEHDDYGVIRFLTNGTALWIPHLFPFEETDESGLPRILDRERCELTVSMRSMRTFEPDEDPDVVISTPYGIVFADTGMNFEYSYGADKNYYKQFSMEQKPLISQLVSYDNRWYCLEAYLDDPTTRGRAEDYPQIMMGRLAMPEEYVLSKAPNDWTKRTDSGHGGTAFGSVWVPIEYLRGGIEANISFPNFLTNTDSI